MSDEAPPQQPSAPGLPVFRISLANATLLSGLYLLVATLVEVIRRVWNPRWVDRVSLSLEAFPARTLELFGLFQPIHEGWLRNEISTLQVRFVFGLTTIAIIFALGTLVGAGMWFIGRLASRAAPQA